jgi:hypothetical protein
MPLGPSVPGYLSFEIPYNLPAGDYLLTVRARDNATWRVASFSYKITVLPYEFTVTPPTVSYDVEGKQPAPYGGLLGQELFFHFRVLRADNSTGKPLLRGRFQVLDRQTGLVLTTTTGDVDGPSLPLPGDDIDATATSRFFLQQTGDFIVRFTVTDTVAGKTASVEVPVNVRAP